MKVLIVDDEEGICRHLKNELQKEGHEVDYTISSSRVLEKLKDAEKGKNAYQLLLLDIKMPKVSGLELLKQIREVYIDLDIIIITGHGDEDTAIEAIQLGAVDYLLKPISLQALYTTTFRLQQKGSRERKEFLVPRILVVDDERELCVRIKRELEKEGYQVATAYDGVEALEYFKNTHVDVIISDIRMPRMDGLELLEKCKEITDNFIPIVITGFGDHEKAIASLRLGAFDYLRKPISIEKLVTSIHKGIEMLLLRRGLLARKRELEIETALKARYAEKVEREKRFTENIVDTIPDSLLILDSSLRIKTANRSFYEMFRSEIDPEKVIRGSIAEILHDKDGRLSAALTRLFGTKDMLENFEMHYQSEKLGGRVFNITARGMSVAAAAAEEEEEEEEELVVLNDITERKRADEEKKKLEAQLYQAQKMEAIGTLAGGIAHDLNNILMGIMGNISLALLDVDPIRPHYKNLKNIEQQSQSAAELTRQLLNFARGGKYKVKPTDLNELIKTGSEIFGRTKKEIKIYTKYQEKIWPVEADCGQIEQVLLNLCVNAWQAMPGGGELYLETENVTLHDTYHIEPGRYVKISVTDTGVGMDEATRQRIFEPFFTTKEMGRGTGLGLASVYGIIKNHGGHINVYSEKGEGTTFTIYLPASESEVSGQKSEISKDVRYGHETILFVDDEDMVIDVGEEILKRLGYKVLPAGSGKKAIDIYKANKDKIDLVILDMIMPDMGGGETCDRIKEINPDIKVLLSSGYSINGEASKILERRCDGFIQKPFGMQELSAKIKETLNPGSEKGKEK